MTPLKAIEQIQLVRGAPSTQYPRNEVCAHPECDKPTESVHHIFGRPPGEYSSSWFVLLPLNGEQSDHHATSQQQQRIMAKRAIPHAIGLCGNGTMGHHGDVEAHRAWIKYEDGVFVWYERATDETGYPLISGLPGAKFEDDFFSVGPLDPQPARATKSRKPSKRKKGEARRKRRTISIRVPDDTEDGGAVWDETIEATKKKLVLLGLYGPQDKIPVYEAVVGSLWDWLNDG